MGAPRFNAIQMKNATFPNIQLSMHANCLRASAKNVRWIALALGMAKTTVIHNNRAAAENTRGAAALWRTKTIL